MAGQVENTMMKPMQTLDSLKQQIVADGEVTPEEIQVFEQNCNTMLANREITEEDFNEAIGWFKNTSVEEQSQTPMLDGLLADRARKDSLAYAKQARKEAEANYQANYDKLGIKELEKELKAKKKRFKKLAKVLEEPNKTRNKSMTIGGISALVGAALTNHVLNYNPICVNTLPDWCHSFLKIGSYSSYKESIWGIKLPVVAAGIVLGLGIGHGVSKIISHNREKNRPQRIEEMRQLEPEIHMLEQQIAELKAQC